MSGVHVRVRVGSERYALPVEHVRQVVELGHVTPIPGAPESVLGLRNLGGEIVPTFDLAAILRIARDARPQRLVVAECAARRAAFAVDEVLDVGVLDGAMQTPESPWLLASTVLDGEMIGVLAVEALLDTVSAEDG